MNTFKKYEGIIKDHGYKLTNQRKAILKVLLDHAGHFLSAEDIYLKTKNEHPKTNFSTVYRNLEMLEEIDILHKTNIKSGASLYEINDCDNHHHHLICKSCGKTEVVNFCPLQALKPNLENRDFTLTDHKFELYGYCHHCHPDDKDGA